MNYFKTEQTMTDSFKNFDNECHLEWEFTADITDRNSRLDKFFSSRLEEEGVSREKVKEWIKKGLACVNGTPCRKPNLKLDGDEVLVLRGESQDTILEAEEDPLDIIYSDESIAVINKPAALTTHPAPSCMTGTLVHRLLHRFPEIRSMHEWRPGIVHRLDKDTSGLIVVALNEQNRIRLAEAFAEREVSKTYVAIVHGKPERPFGEIDAPIGRHPSQKTKMAVTSKGGREAYSSYEVIWTSPGNTASLIRVKIHTGRTHQIRVHMAHLGHPLLGDTVYGSQQHSVLTEKHPELAELSSRQMLHAFDVRFNHPESQEPMHFTLEPPQDFIKVLEALYRRTLRVGLVGMPVCGKSTVLKILSRMGIPGFSADESVARAYKRDGDGTALIRQRFGNRFNDPESGDIDKSILFEAMCEDENIRREIMDIVHPIVLHEMNEFFRENSGHDFAIAEIPLLLEAGWHEKGYIDLVAGISCPIEKRTEELRKKREISPDMLATLDSWQWNEESKLKACDIVLDNSNGIENLKKEASRATKILSDIKKEKEARFRKKIDTFFTAQPSEKS